MPMRVFSFFLLALTLLIDQNFIVVVSEVTPIKKTVFSDRTRLLFVAGLEGTGHHAIAHMMSECRKEKMCESDSVLSKIAMTFDPTTRQTHGLFSSYDSDNFTDNLLLAERQMEKLVNSPGDHLFYLGLNNGRGGGMLSYPNFMAENKALDHPDIVPLVQIAEKVGLDFRVLVLQRSAAEILASTKSRDFAQNNHLEAKILVDNAAALYSQLKLIDRKFFYCVQYRDLGIIAGNPDKKTHLLYFLHPMNLARDSLFDDMLDKVVYSNNTVPLVMTADSGHKNKNKNTDHTKKEGLSDVLMSSEAHHVFQLEARLTLINQLCSVKM